ncbi:MAG: response regulator transcription factor, partial [Lachnospiraceae bacterium]|nr:response regulator transcription factor [Lachnospiraceae bacterium]
MTNIAIIEDDKGLNNGIALALKQEDYRFYQYSALKEAENMEDMDLVILDINLPDGNGFDFLKELRMRSDVPVIILTAN